MRHSPGGYSCLSIEYPPNLYLPLEVPGRRHLDSQQFRSAPKDLRTCAVRLLMRHTACAWRFLPAIIGGGTWEAAPMPGMRRRDFVTLLGGAAAWPLAARAQQSGRVRRIGVIMGDFDLTPRIKAFKSAWPALGWVEGRNVHVDYHFAAGNPTASDLTLPRSSLRRPKSFLSEAHRSWPRCGKRRNPFQRYLLEFPSRGCWRCRQPQQTRSQPHRFREFRAGDRRQMAANTQGGCAKCDARRGASQSGWTEAHNDSHRDLGARFRRGGFGM